MDQTLRENALHYHRHPKPGKLEIVPTKAMSNQRDLSLAYSPGVAAACEEIVRDPNEAARLTSRGNLVAVITNGTAVLGLGDIGPLAAKPVMEGKSVLFKKFSGIDSIDIEINEKDPDKLVEIIASMEPSFGGINLEDIKAPQCFEVEAKLRERMNIPVFHDDQHGTAIIVGAAIYNWLRLAERKIEEVRLVASGAGAAAIACLDVLVGMGMLRKNIIVVDRNGVVFAGRNESMDPFKEKYAADTKARTLKEALVGADIFLGLSGPNVMGAEELKVMAPKPLILALANPTPEVDPAIVAETRPDAIMATGRSDYPNQVNNVLCFPFIFRGALDVGATTINEQMKIACVRAIADLATEEITEAVASAYGRNDITFGPHYLIPKPFDPRLIVRIAPAVAIAAMESGVATRPINDMNAYREALNQFVFRSGFVMRNIFIRAKEMPKKIVFAEGEDERVLRAVQQMVDDQIAKPVLIGSEATIHDKLKELRLRLTPGKDFEIFDLEHAHHVDAYAQTYHQLLERRGVSPALAQTVVRTNSTAVASLMVQRGEADGMLCGAVGQYQRNLKLVNDIIGLKAGVASPAALHALILDHGTYFVADTQVSVDPSAREIADIALLAADWVNMFGIDPKVALLSHSNFGSYEDEQSIKMRRALAEIQLRDPSLEVDGEMQADSALVEEVRAKAMPRSRLKGQANVLIMPNLSAANIALNMTRALGEGLTIGPILMGIAQPVHIITPSTTARGILNMTALTVVQAQIQASGSPSRHNFDFRNLLASAA